MTLVNYLHQHRLWRQIVGRPRLLISAMISLIGLAAMPGEWQLSTRLLIAWNAGIWIYIAAAFVSMLRSNEARMRRNALMTDESRFAVLVLCTLAAVASIVAIFAQLSGVKDMHGLLRGLHVGLAAGTIVSAWAFIHIIFAQHYAHEYYIERKGEAELPEELRGGLQFIDTRQPDYSDFMYFSFVIGVASQTADIVICSRTMRRVALAHCVLAFFFNTAVLALTINIAAGML